MHLAKPERAAALAGAGVHDVLVSIHGLGATAGEIHGRGRHDAERQMQALDNLRELGVPFRFNVTVIRDNLTQLEAIAELAAARGARVVNFLTFNPYFEWQRGVEIGFQVRHSEAAPYLKRAIDVCSAAGVEANVRYMPLCALPGYEQHVYTGFQLPTTSTSGTTTPGTTPATPAGPAKPGTTRHPYGSSSATITGMCLPAASARCAGFRRIPRAVRRPLGRR